MPVDTELVPIENPSALNVILGQTHFIKTAEDVKSLAAKNALAVGAGHFFIVFLRDAFPINVLRALRDVPEVVTIFAATANPVDVIVAKTPRGRGVLGVVDGERTKGVEGTKERQDRISFLRKIGYKLG